MKREGFTLIVLWQGGLSLVTTSASSQRVQKTAPSVHRFNQKVVKSWLDFPTRTYDIKQWTKLPENVRVEAHVKDFIHDLSSRGIVASWYIQEAN